MGMMPGDGDEFGESAADASPDEALKNWVYVDLDGKPFTAGDLASAPAAKILRLMPFVLRATIDQRALDALLVELSSAGGNRTYASQLMNNSNVAEPKTSRCSDSANGPILPLLIL